jgi:hypothetical protein
MVKGLKFAVVSAIFLFPYPPQRSFMRRSELSGGRLAVWHG